MDKIKIRNLEIYARHGVFPEENKLGQKFLVSVILYTDIHEAGKEDDLKKSIDYAMVCEMVQEEMTAHTYQLIEAAAEHLAEKLLLRIECLKKVKVQIQKPWAPIGMPMDSVAVEIKRKWHTAYIALGSNMGNREEYLNQAIDKISQISGCIVEQVADYIETEPVGYLEQDDFLNSAIKISTIHSPENLLAILLQIEQELGRVREIHWGPRTIDLDLIFYGKQKRQTEYLMLPHPQMHKRAFVLKPMLELAADKRHPVLHKTVKELWEEFKKEG